MSPQSGKTGKSPQNGILAQAREVLTIEAEGVQALIGRLDQSFASAVELIYSCPGRTIVSGIGKSGLIARKIVATLNSTGTPALFLHPVEGMHGDLGMVTGSDVVLAISNSGETEELCAILPAVRSLGGRLIAFTGNPDSTLGRLADLTVDTGVAREACPARGWPPRPRPRPPWPWATPWPSAS